jgi:hypothetical protein
MNKNMSRNTGSGFAGKKGLIFGILAAFVLVILPQQSFAYGYNPSLVVSAQGGDSTRITVSNAAPYSQITLYERQGTTLWTTITNFGQTDSSGYFSQVITLGSNNSNAAMELYASVAGDISSTARVYPNSSVVPCSYYGCGGSPALSLSQNSVSVNVGQSTTVTVYNAVADTPFNISSNTNSNAVDVSVYASQITLTGKNAGTSTVTVCSRYGQVCGSILVTVSGNSGTVTLSPPSVNVNVGQTATVNAGLNYPTSGNFYFSSYPNANIATVSISGSTISVYGASNGTTAATICYTGINNCAALSITVNGYSSNGSVSVTPSTVTVGMGSTQQATIYNTNYNYYGYTIGYNSNSNIVSPSISGNTLTLYGVNNGNATVQVCMQYAISNCATVYVTVTGSGNYGGQLIFNTTSLPQATIGQYYSQQLQVTGGTSPYTFILNYGTLPSGMSLSNSGLLYGTPQSSSYSSFNVKVSDYYGRQATQSFTLTPNGGSVLGASQYPNGTLISENGTIYIVYKNTKTGFANWNTFTGLGFSLGNVQYASYSGLANSGYIVQTPYASHPWGSWVKSGQTVYFVFEQGLIPVGDYGTFLNNGGRDALVVQSNSWDFNLPILPVMNYNDYRLK